MATGTVKRVVPDRGFGFIEDSSGTEYFFHRSVVADFDSLRGGETATFEVEDGPKGKRANSVRIGEPEAAAPAEPAAAPAEPETAAPEAAAPEAASAEATAPDAEPAAAEESDAHQS
jgi:CspA family cold shock protein